MGRTILRGRLVGVCRLYYSTRVSFPLCRQHTYILKQKPGFQFFRYKHTAKPLASAKPVFQEKKIDDATDATQLDKTGARHPNTQEKTLEIGGELLVGKTVSVLNGVAREVDSSNTQSQSHNVDTTHSREELHGVMSGREQDQVLPASRLGNQLNNLTLHNELPVGATSKHKVDTVSEQTEVIASQEDEASSQTVIDQKWKPIIWEREHLVENYLKLAKIRLTGLVVLTTMAGYAMAPGAFHLSTFALCTLGTGLQSASANAINQFLEVPYDAQMNRTKNRPIIRGAISPLHAVAFAGVTGSAGLGILLFGVNPLTAGLGMANLILYTSIYTPMKRLSIANTWLGSFVGAVPPMMGWAACAGQLDPGAWLLGAILYAWQFPHFNALSWNLRPDYSRAGYRMTSVVNPALCKRVALRYCGVMVGLCTLAPVLDLTVWTFALESLPLNLWFTYLAYRFYRDGDSKSSRKLFRFSLLHIPILMVLLLISKKNYGELAKKTPTGIIDITLSDINIESAKVSEVLATKTVGVSS